MSIKARRKQKGITQETLAKMLGVTQGAVSLWELGEREPNIRILKQMANIFECSIDELLCSDDGDGDLI
jgi:transcriptional regulator with XRE-family HTH domain